MEIEDEVITLKSISNGLLCGDFSFQANEYTYVERGMSTPVESQYNILENQEREIDVTCHMSLIDGTIVVEMPFIECSPLPRRLCTKLYPGKYNLIGNEEDNFRILVIPFPDMDSFSFNTQINYRMELHFHEKELCCLAFTISTMDANFHMSEVIIHLYGYIIDR